MKNKYQLLLIVFIITGVQVFGQIIEGRTFLFLYSDSVIYGNNIEYKTSLFQSSYFLVDTNAIDAKLVRFYKCNKGLYANTKASNYFGSTEFIKLIIKGNINFYQKVKYYYTPGHPPNIENYFYNYDSGIISNPIKIINYFNVGLEDLKKISYKNLYPILSSKPESLLYLNKYKEVKKVVFIYEIIAFASISGSALLLTQKEKKIVLGTSFGLCGIVSYIIGSIKSQSLSGYFTNAIIKYNKN